MNFKTIVSAVLAVAFAFIAAAPARADEIPEKYRKMVDKGLEFLVKQQNEKGFWDTSASNDTYRISMTALAGMALLMEGSTINEGKYAANIKKAVDWLMDKSQQGNQMDGLIGNPTIPNESFRYMYGHGFSLMFLASVYGDEQNAKKRARLQDILVRAVKYSINAQAENGGWYYFAKGDLTSNNPAPGQDEGSVTITQVQALRAARNAGIPVPKDVIRKVYDYLKSVTGPNGGVYYSSKQKEERPAVTVAAVACLFNAGEYKDELSKKWLKYCQQHIPLELRANQGPRLMHAEYTHYYFSQSIYTLGDAGWEKLFGPTPEALRLTWTKYRNTIGDLLLQVQNADGSWPATSDNFNVGGVYSTAMYLAVMQLDKGVLPIYQR